MTATPAWPPRSAPRLFVDQPLAEGATLRIESGQAHYLLNVMRLAEGALVKLFDDRSGEYAARISARGKRDLDLSVETMLRPRETSPDFWLCAAPSAPKPTTTAVKTAPMPMLFFRCLAIKRLRDCRRGGASNPRAKFIRLQV